MNPDKTMVELHNRLPMDTEVFARLRASGWSWEQIEDRLDGLTEDIARSNMPFSDEPERYVRRLLIAAYAEECGSMNN